MLRSVVFIDLITSKAIKFKQISDLQIHAVKGHRPDSKVLEASKLTLEYREGFDNK